MASTTVSKNRSLLFNTTALFVLQIANYVFPFLLIPYLTRVLGASLYGVVAFGISMAQIANIITDYGFNLSATYSIAKEQDNKSYIDKIIGAVFVCKIALLICVSLLLGGYIVAQSKYEEYNVFLWLMLISVLGQTFQPIWFFQGIEKMVFITICTVLSRTIYLVLVVLLVNGAEDLNQVALSYGFANIAAAICGVVMMYRLGYRVILPSWSFIKEVFNSSTGFFLSRAAVATYTTCGTFFLGLVSTPTQVAYYSAAEQLYKGAQAIFSPVSQSMYPHMAKHKNFSLFFKVMKLTVLASLIGILIGIFLGPTVLRLVFGEEFVSSYPILIVFLFIFAITTPSILLGYPFLGALGQIKLANQSVLYAGLLQVVLLVLFYFLNFKQGFQVSLSVLSVECIVLLLRVLWAKKFYALNKPALAL